MKKSKKARQRWWRSLTEEERSAYLDKVVEGKAIARRKRSLVRMAKHPGEYSCSTCFHHKTKSCTYKDMPNGCEYWYDPLSQKKGLAYAQEQD